MSPFVNTSKDALLMIKSLRCFSVEYSSPHAIYSTCLKIADSYNLCYFLTITIFIENISFCNERYVIRVISPYVSILTTLSRKTA